MPPPDRPPLHRVIVGGALLTIGVLIFVPSGLCTAIMGLIGVVQMIANPKEFVNDVMDMGLVVLIVPAVAVGGYLLIRFGLAIGRK